jgi:ubiquinone/menaquinone biosynthesis C-methylase UbiE
MPIGDFTEQAAAYRASRPTYPAAMVEELTAHLASGDPVADIGAGTGIFTRLLADRGLAVTAVEPNEAMRAEAEPDARVRWVDGTFEDTSLADGSQRWAVAAQAFHWAEPRKALPELKRVLAPGGAFTALWNDRENDKSPVLRFVRDAIRRHVPGFDEAYRNRDWGEVLTRGGSFRKASYRELSHAVKMSRERFLALWRGHNRLNNLAGRERFERLFAEIGAFLDRERLDEIDVPYCCRAWTAS